VTEAEIFEAVTSNWANAISAFAIFISFTFAYLATAFFVGTQLTRLQVIIASTLYCFAASSALISLIGSHQVMEAAIRLGPNVIEGIPFARASFWTPYMVAVMVSGQVVCLYFMYDIRHQFVSAESSA
jgi:hypothetical protein